MNNKRIELMIKAAIVAIYNSKIASKDREIESKYFGYIASYGPTIIQSGLSQSVQFYAGDESKNKINKIIADVLKQVKLMESESLDECVRKAIGTQGYKKLKTNILEAIIAIKLAMRTFKKIKGE